jgi:uncharacterized protein (DUF927 family)
VRKTNSNAKICFASTKTCTVMGTAIVSTQAMNPLDARALRLYQNRESAMALSTVRTKKTNRSANVVSENLHATRPIQLHASHSFSNATADPNALLEKTNWVVSNTSNPTNTWAPLFSESR